jgi:hypothetical protein
VRDCVLLFTGPPTIRVFDNPGSGTLTVRLQAWFPAAIAVRPASAIAVLTGTGLSAVLA